MSYYLAEAATKPILPCPCGYEDLHNWVNRATMSHVHVEMYFWGPSSVGARHNYDSAISDARPRL